MATIEINLSDVIKGSGAEGLKEARKLLAQTVLPWETDSHGPKKYMRRFADARTSVAYMSVGTRSGCAAIVDPWVGGFENDPHNPMCIGWKVEGGIQGIVTRNEKETREQHFARAFTLADLELVRVAKQKHLRLVDGDGPPEVS
jgi:hypothetical protein